MPPRKSRKDPGPQPQASFRDRFFPDAKTSKHPGFIPLQLATLRDIVPTGGRWLYEIKFDGYRMQAQRQDSIPRIFTRSGLDWTNKFSFLEGALAMLPARELIIDGEIVSPDKSGRPNFSSLQADIAADRQDRMIYYAFDLLYLDGVDLRNTPLIKRKKMLQTFVDEAKSEKIVYSEHFEKDGKRVFESACEHHLEGIIAKRTDGIYKSGRSEEWLKIKCAMTDQFVIVGYVPGGHGGGLGAIRLGRKKGGELVYAGKTGTGFNAKNSSTLMKQLRALEITKPPLKMPAKKRDTKWVEPELVANIEYRDITDEGYLRHSSFKGLSQ